MMFVRITFLVLFALNIAEAKPLPFWKGKEKYYERIKEGEVLVSVRSAEPVNPEHRHSILITGGGRVKAPAIFVFDAALDFERVAKMSGYIEKAKFNVQSKVLTLDLSAYGHKGQMDFALNINRDAQPKTIGYEVIRGPMMGFRGEFSFEDIGRNVSEVGMGGEFSYKTFPIPKLFLEFGLQVVFQKMAVRLRQNVEEEFRKKEPK